MKQTFKRTKKEKGITLVALIITIIILLILAVVTIAAITGDGDLISHANNTKQKYADESAKENTIIQNYLDYIDDNTGSGEVTEKSNAWIAYLFDPDDDTKIRYYANTELNNDEIANLYIEGISLAKIIEDYNVSLEYISKDIELQHFMIYTEFNDDYNYSNGEFDYEWTVSPKDKSKTSYNDTIKSNLFGKSVTGLDFSDCNLITDLSNINIPSTVTNLEAGFMNCSLLTQIPIIPISVEKMHHCFYNTPVTTFTYAGTVEQSSLINDSCSNRNRITVVCSDGTIEID